MICLLAHHRTRWRTKQWQRLSHKYRRTTTMPWKIRTNLRCIRFPMWFLECLQLCCTFYNPNNLNRMDVSPNLIIFWIPWEKLSPWSIFDQCGTLSSFDFFFCPCLKSRERDTPCRYFKANLNEAWNYYPCGRLSGIHEPLRHRALCARGTQDRKKNILALLIASCLNFNAICKMNLKKHVLCFP